MAANEHAFDKIVSVPVHYDRLPVAAYGTEGKARTFHCTHAFYRKLEGCFRELWQVCPDGTARTITSAGAQVSKGGMHGAGRAFDLDAIFWPGRTFVTKEFKSYPGFYLGVEAVLRKHFGIVLDFNYNAAHQDHFHIDDGRPTGYGERRSHTVFMQAVCYHIFAKRFPGNVDGKFGSNTRRVVNEICQEMGVSTPLNAAANWKQFLDAVALRGMGVNVINMPPMTIRGHVDRLEFNGRTLTWIRGGVKYKSWPAVSGRSRYQSRKYQGLKKKGPIPEGKWVVRQSEYQKMPSRSWLEQLAAELGRTAWPGGASSWGRNRIWLKPLPGTRTLGRSGFSIHGGDSPGSAGCIDLTSSMPAFTREFLNCRKDLQLDVKYHG